MTDLQELITRGRMILAGAEKRLQAFELVNGGRSTKEIAKKMGRDLRSLDRDLGMIRDMELIQEKKDTNGKAIRKDGHTVYEKSPLIKHVPISYFGPVANTSKLVKTKPKGHTAISRTTSIHIPSENEILDICNEGEGQLYEFKAPGVSADKITKEISGFLHTKSGGVLFYGIEDGGAIIGADMRRQDLDQRIQNSVRNTVSPSPSIEIKERKVNGFVCAACRDSSLGQKDDLPEHLGWKVLHPKRLEHFCSETGRDQEAASRRLRGLIRHECVRDLRQKLVDASHVITQRSARVLACRSVPRFPG